MQHEAPPEARLRDGGVDERGLADAGVAIDEQELAVARIRRVQQVLDRTQLRLTLEQSDRPRAGGCDARAFAQKTGELP